MNIEAKHPLLLVGCGKMGSAILSGLLPQIPSSVCIKVVDPNGIPTQTRKDGISVFKEAKELPSNFEPSIIIFAVKPQQMEKVVPYYLRFVESGAFFISIAAGTTIKFFEGILGSNAPIVRAMPNTPALIQQAITVACPNSAITDSQLEAAKLLLGTIGEVIFISDEDLLDPVTAISGSGPAYVFFMICFYANQLRTYLFRLKYHSSCFNTKSFCLITSSYGTCVICQRRNNNNWLFSQERINLLLNGSKVTVKI